MLLIFTAAALWVLCGLIVYAGALAYFQGKFKELAVHEYTEDRRFATWMGVTGPVGLILAMIFTRAFTMYGLRFR